MPKRSLMACSLLPAWRHHWRSNASMSRSRSSSSAGAGAASSAAAGGAGTASSGHRKSSSTPFASGVGWAAVIRPPYDGRPRPATTDERGSDADDRQAGGLERGDHLVGRAAVGDQGVDALD